MPYVDAFIGATIDTAQMVQITQYAEIFYHKRFILEKEARISVLIGNSNMSGDEIVENQIVTVED